MSKKILFFLHFPPPVHGSSMVGQFIHESVFINTSFKTLYIDVGTSRQIDEIGKGGIKKLLRYITIIYKALLTLISFKPDLCYLAISARGGAFYKDALLALLIKAMGIKITYHFHNKGVKDNHDKWLDNLLYKIVFRNSSVILLSRYLYVDIEKYVPQNRVYYCPNGIPENKVKELNKNIESHTRSSPVQILFLSNLIESKGVSVLLEACQFLRKKNLNFYCRFIGGEGDISEQDFNQKVSENYLQSYVSYLGKRFGDEKEKYFSETDIFAFPTYYHYECFPLVLLEAMQSSLPVISTYEGGIRDIVEENKTGFLVPQRNVHVLADKLELLIRNPELRIKMGEAGHSKYKEEFTLPIFEKRFIAILQNILSQDQ